MDLLRVLKQKALLLRQNTTFAGRLANYKYVSKDKAIANVFQVFYKETKKFMLLQPSLKRICIGSMLFYMHYQMSGYNGLYRSKIKMM